MLRFTSLLLALLFICGHGIREAGAAKCPNLVIVLDKSGSMLDGPDGNSAPPGGTKWDLAKKAVLQVLERYDGQLPIGLSLFAGDDVCGAGNLDVAPAYDTKVQISDIINKESANSATPTGPTIDNLRKLPPLKDASRSQYMLLLTDGEPNCADQPDPAYTVKTIEDAAKQVPPIYTFVVGFGRLPASAAAAMDQMAVAGGKPATGGDHKYYEAESLDVLNKALDDIFKVVLAEGGGAACDDSCYAADVGCPNPGHRCIRGECRANPCQGVTCGPGLYCYTDGVSAARCVSACTKQCAKGTRCEMGKCIKDACPAPCIAGFVCNRQSGVCEPDPLCPADRPRREQCTSPSQCQYGTCIDEPCQFITCPKGTACVPWNGSCEFIPVAAAPDMAISEEEEDDVKRSGGCSSGSHQKASLSALMVMLAATLVLRRRRERG